MRTFQNRANVWLFLVVVFAAMSLMTACSGGNDRKPMSLEQRAFAVYGTFTTLEEAAAKIVSSPGVPEGVIQRLREADAVAKPLADSMYNAALFLQEVRETGTPTKEAEQALIATYTEAVDAIDEFESIINAWKERNGEHGTPGFPIP